MIGLVLASAGVLKCQARLMAQDIKPVRPAPIGTINDVDLSPDKEVIRNQRPGIGDRQKWEYISLMGPVGNQATLAQLNTLGEQGWELIPAAFEGNWLCLRRSK